MRLETEGFPHPLNGRLGKARFIGHRSAGPVCGSLWLLPESRIDQGGDFIIIDRSRSTGSQFVVEPHQTLPAETTAPLPDCGTRETKLLSYLMVGETTITQQHDPGTPNERMWHTT